MKKSVPQKRARLLQPRSARKRSQFRLLRLRLRLAHGKNTGKPVKLPQNTGFSTPRKAIPLRLGNDPAREETPR
ncbi:hypothetical protein AKJ08_0987 [Vulgatibacter incomptus]|uniref:Uncharacterized protein n=1 Tax=Vulgatibacter incomptus TaxID=1391653 RepID=A0A0K1PAQ3_9BACT|nr:hypothetical protein AKJ08_0987 [Vulgatibacter incomptus]